MGPGAERVGTGLTRECHPCPGNLGERSPEGGLRITLQGPQLIKSWVNICPMSDHKIKEQKTSHAKIVLSPTAFLPWAQSWRIKHLDYG